MRQRRLSTQTAQKQKPASTKGSEPDRWFDSYESAQLLFEIIREEIARLPRARKLTVLAQIDSLREDVSEMVEAGFWSSTNSSSAGHGQALNVTASRQI